MQKDAFLDLSIAFNVINGLSAFIIAIVNENIIHHSTLKAKTSIKKGIHSIVLVR